VAAERGVEFRDLGWRKENVEGWPYRRDLWHVVETNGFFTRLVCACRREGRHRLAQWWSERQAARRWGSLVQPDGYGQLEGPTSTRSFFLELDRDTEGSARLRGKLVGYESVAMIEERPDLLLFCFPDPQREAFARKVLCSPGTLADPNRLTVAGYLDHWLAHARHRVRPSTYQRYVGIVRHDLVPGLGRMKLAKVRPLHIQAFEARMLSSGRLDGKGGLSARTVLHVHRVFSGALAQAVRWQLLAVNPARAVQPPRPERPQLTIPDREAVSRILAQAEETQFHIPVLLAASTGMRRGEILGE